ncbi:MAG: HAMP domain-containing histidine kinase [Euryarchaeota archaeon]|nr:HAMP domain-containing histidine kinase [Euryarchaeota archaeon]
MALGADLVREGSKDTAPSAPAAPDHGDPARLQERFARERREGYQRVLKIGCIAAATVMLLDAFVFWRTGQDPYLVFALLAALVLATASYGLILLQSGRLERALAVPLVYLLVIAPVGPALVASRALVSIALPFIVMAVAMNYASPRHLRAYGVLSWVSGTTVMAFWQWRMLRIAGLDAAFGAASLIAGSLVLGFTFYALSHYSHRLRYAFHEAQETAVRLEAAHQELRGVDAARVRFMNNAAHELKTPLTPIGIQLHLLRRSEGAQGPKIRHSVDVLARNFKRLERLVGDILDGARMAAGKLEFRFVPVALSDTLHEAIEEYERAAESSGIGLEHDIEDDLHVAADPLRIHQVVDNLVYNALKFTGAGGTVRLDAFAAGDDVVVRVQDTGIGIAPQDLERLFQPFTQVHDPMKTVTGGSGLGLSIARGIVERHGGRILAESEGLGHGATFTFLLPRLPHTERDESAPSGDRSGPIDGVTPSDARRA